MKPHLFFSFIFVQVKSCRPRTLRDLAVVLTMKIVKVMLGMFLEQDQYQILIKMGERNQRRRKRRRKESTKRKRNIKRKGKMKKMRKRFLW